MSFSGLSTGAAGTVPTLQRDTESYLRQSGSRPCWAPGVVAEGQGPRAGRWCRVGGTLCRSLGQQGSPLPGPPPAAPLAGL